MHKYKWLLLDADNTFLDFASASKRSFFTTCENHNLNIDDDTFKVYKTENAKVWEAFENKEITAIELRSLRFERFFQAAGIKGIDPLDFNARFLINLIDVSTTYTGAIRFLEALTSHFKLSVITNGLKEVQRPRITKLNMNHLFESIIVSDEIGVAKPDIAFFEYSYNTLSNPPDKSEVLVIGDSLNSDIQGGINFGVDTCWISHQRTNNSSIDPTYTVNNLFEIESILK